MAFGSLVLSAGFAAALVWQSVQGTVVPWWCRSTISARRKPSAPATADFRPTDPQIAWHLGRFIEQVRSIPADPIIVRQNWLRAYEWTTDRGAGALNDYARTNDPFTKVDKQQIAVDVSSVIELPRPSVSRGRNGILRTASSPARNMGHVWLLRSRHVMPNG